jgi:hypothetical protein
MLRSALSLLAALPLLFGMPPAVADSDAHATSATSAKQVQTIFETKMALRDLWVEHIFWIRSYILAANAHDEAQRAAAESEILANAQALAAVIEPFYGAPAKDALLKLLAGHWEAVRAVHSASGEKVATDKALAALTKNAGEIAKFLSKANPYLPEDAVLGLLSAHGAHHAAQIEQLAARDFRTEAETWHAMRRHMHVIADAMVDALAKQFPASFGGMS